MSASRPGAEFVPSLPGRGAAPLPSRIGQSREARSPRRAGVDGLEVEAIRVIEGHAGHGVVQDDREADGLGAWAGQIGEGRCARRIDALEYGLGARFEGRQGGQEKDAGDTSRPVKDGPIHGAAPVESWR